MAWEGRYRDHPYRRNTTPQAVIDHWNDPTAEQHKTVRAHPEQGITAHQHYGVVKRGDNGA